MPRPKKNYDDLPSNLTFDKTNHCYLYRDPSTHKRHSLGANRKDAINAALQLNSILMPGADLVAKVLNFNPDHYEEQQAQHTLNEYLDQKFIPKVLPTKKLRKSTLYDYHNKFKHIREHLGHRPFAKINVRVIAEFLDRFPKTQSNRYRCLLNVVFKHARAAGWTEENPVEITLNKAIEKKRHRLKREEYDILHATAGDMGLCWLQNAMDLGLYSLQRESDILRMKFKDIVVEERRGQPVEIIKVIQQKTEKHGEAAFIKVEIGPELKRIIKRCKDNLLSPYLVHRRPEKIYRSKNKDHFTQVLPQYLIHRFAEVRDQSGLFKRLKPLERPSFHEIRSLGIKMYSDQGYAPQQLAGHTTEAMTEEYMKGHGVRWTYAASL